jgi:hypothetical protein
MVNKGAKDKKLSFSFGLFFNIVYIGAIFRLQQALCYLLIRYFIYTLHEIICR